MVQFFSNLHLPWNDTKEAPKKKLHGSYVNIRAEVSSIIPSLDTLPLLLCTLDISIMWVGIVIIMSASIEAEFVKPFLK